VNESVSQYTFGELTEDTAYIYSEETKNQTRTSPGGVTVGPLSPPGIGK